MKLARLSNRGFAHQILVLVVILLIAVGGTFTLVASKAATHAPAGSRIRIAKMAKQQMNYKESSVKRNKVKYFSWPGDTPAGKGPWCSVFLSWVWHAAGVDLDGRPYPLQPAVESVLNTGKDGNRFHAYSKSPKGYKPRIGDAILYGPSGGDHIGVVVTVSKSGRKIIVIEGNTNRRKGGDDLYVNKRVINLNKPTNIPHNVIYGFVAPPGT